MKYFSPKYFWLFFDEIFFTGTCNRYGYRTMLYHIITPSENYFNADLTERSERINGVIDCARWSGEIHLLVDSTRVSSRWNKGARCIQVLREVKVPGWWVAKRLPGWKVRAGTSSIDRSSLEEIRFASFLLSAFPGQKLLSTRLADLIKKFFNLLCRTSLGAAEIAFD